MLLRLASTLYLTENQQEFSPAIRLYKENGITVASTCLIVKGGQPRVKIFVQGGEDHWTWGDLIALPLIEHTAESQLLATLGRTNPSVAPSGTNVGIGTRYVRLRYVTNRDVHAILTVDVLTKIFPENTGLGF